MKKKRGKGCFAAIVASAAFLLCAMALPVAALLWGAYVEQNQPNEWYLSQIESRLGADLGEGDWGACEALVYGSIRDMHLETAVCLNEPLNEARLAGLIASGRWSETPGDDALIAELRGMGAVSEELREQMCSALAVPGNAVYTDIDRDAGWLRRFDVCVLDRRENVLYVVCLDF